MELMWNRTVMSAKAFFHADASNPIVRTIVRSVSTANNGKYRLYYVPGYRCFMYLNLSEPLTLRRLCGRYERPKIDYFKRLLRPGMVFVDVGANLGDFSLIASRLIGAAGKVVAFEPDPENYGWLSKSIKRNKLSNIELRAEALSNEDGQASFFLSQVSGWHTLKKDQLSNEKQEIVVPTRRLDGVPLDRLDVMKIDVEGAEFEVLQGAREQISRFNPTIFIDLHPAMGADVDGCLNMLRALGYNIFGFDGHGRCREYREQDGEVVALPRRRETETQ
jgi:FkbM family methyltransferase